MHGEGSGRKSNAGGGGAGVFSRRGLERCSAIRCINKRTLARGLAQNAKQSTAQRLNNTERIFKPLSPSYRSSRALSARPHCPA
eukprot:350931-Chlamydomonas_euryale.AAC.1